MPRSRHDPSLQVEMKDRKGTCLTALIWTAMFFTLFTGYVTMKCDTFCYRHRILRIDAWNLVSALQGPSRLSRSRCAFLSSAPPPSSCATPINHCPPSPLPSLCYLLLLSSQCRFVPASTLSQKTRMRPYNTSFGRPNLLK